MYKLHPDLPAFDINEKIWHYFSLSKFLGFISTSSLYLCREDKFDDSFEGAMTQKDAAFFNSISPGTAESMRGDSLGCVYVNCWTRSDVDEYVLWGSYSSLKDGIAVQSSVLKLISSLDETDKRPVYISNVQYIDYDKEYSFGITGGNANMIAPHFSKRRYFEAEKELRVMYWDTSGKFDKTPAGLYFKVDISTLIERVYVAPSSYPWLVTVIQEILQKYGLNKEVLKSGI